MSERGEKFWKNFQYRVRVYGRQQISDYSQLPNGLRRWIDYIGSRLYVADPKYTSRRAKPKTIPPCKGCGNPTEGFNGICQACVIRRGRMHRRQALVMRECGMKYREIGEHFKVGAQRAKDLVSRGSREFMVMRRKNDKGGWDRGIE